MTPEGKLAAHNAVIDFCLNHIDDYYTCPENTSKMEDFILGKGWKLGVLKNLEEAFRLLSEAGELLPVGYQPPPAQVVAEVVPPAKQYPWGGELTAESLAALNSRIINKYSADREWKDEFNRQVAAAQSVTPYKLKGMGD